MKIVNGEEEKIVDIIKDNYRVGKQLWKYLSFVDLGKERPVGEGVGKGQN